MMPRPHLKSALQAGLSLLLLGGLASGAPAAHDDHEDAATDGGGNGPFCGAPNASKVVPGTPWIVFSMNYNYKAIKGTCCVSYSAVTGAAGSDDQTIAWSTDWDLDPKASPELVKGYEFVGLTEGLENQISAIKAIPSHYTWKVDAKTPYKGNVVYDFITGPTKGDSTSSKAQELMLWLTWVGGQIPFGYADGPVGAPFSLYGKDGWTLYQGLNKDTGLMVYSLLAPADAQFAGEFSGDVRDWLLALADRGVLTGGRDAWVNVGNAGMEPFFGTVSFSNTLSLRIDV